MTSYTLNEIVGHLGGELIGEGSTVIHRVASLANAESGQIAFCAHNKYFPVLENCRASAVIVNAQSVNATSKPRILTDNPYAYFAKLSALINPTSQLTPVISSSATIHTSAVIPASCVVMAGAVIGQGVRLGEQVVISANCVIGDHVTIAENTCIDANVVIYANAKIGARCHFSSGVVIGSDGFGYAEETASDGSQYWIKIPQIGRVVISDDVDIGSNSTIDCGALDDTVIEKGVKIDNLVQIGHNCRIGSHSVIAGCVGIAGSAIIGKHCKIGGAAMILGHLTIADYVTISPGSMITKSIHEAATYTALMPFQQHDDWLKTAVHIRNLNELTDKIKLLEKIVKNLKT